MKREDRKNDANRSSFRCSTDTIRKNINKKSLPFRQAFLLLNFIGDFVNELFGFFPTKAGVGDGLTVNVFADLLRAVLNI